MKMMFSGIKLFWALLTSALFALSGPAMAADSDLAAQIYGSGKATMRFPDEANRYDAAPEYYGGQRLTTFSGTVYRVRARDYFDFRAVDGRTYRVIARDSNDSFNVSSGERVEVSGFLTHDLIIASRVRQSGYGNRPVDFPGTVSSVNSTYRFTVRGDNGRTYTIDSRNRLPYNLSAGDYVRIIGTWTGSAVSADQVIVLRDGYGGGSGYRQVDFPGTVIEVGRDRNTLRVRGENGFTYTVFYTGADQFRVWERVRVVGYADSYQVRATAVYRR